MRNNCNSSSSSSSSKYSPTLVCNGCSCYLSSFSSRLSRSYVEWVSEWVPDSSVVVGSVILIRFLYSGFCVQLGRPFAIGVIFEKRLSIDYKYRVTMVVRDYVLLTSFLKFPTFHHLAQLLCHFRPLCTCSSRIRQSEEQPSQSQPNLFSDHHVPACTHFRNGNMCPN